MQGLFPNYTIDKSEVIHTKDKFDYTIQMYYLPI